MTDVDERALLERVPDGLFIGGAWRSAEDGETLDVADPSTGTVIKRIASATPVDGLAALSAASDAFPGWATTSLRERSELLRRAFDLCSSATRSSRS